VLPVALAVVVVAGMAGTPAVAGQPAPNSARWSDQSALPSQSSVETPQIVDLYPNPVARNDDGEFVTLWLPLGTPLDDLTLGDEQTTVGLTLPENATEPRPPPDSGWYLTVSTEPGLTRSLTDRRVGAIEGNLQLANNGDELRLRRNGTVVDSVAYDDAPDGEVYNASRKQWHQLNATAQPVVSARGGIVEAFVLPDEPDRAVEFLDSADERILLAGYTLTSQRVVDVLLAAHERGVTVEVLVDGSPVGGLSKRSATALDRLSAAGIPVRLVGGERARVRFHHPKYAVVDDRVLVTTENWKPAGTGGRGSRGWAVITGQRPIVDGLVDTYRADAGWVDAIPWQEFEPDTLVEAEPASRSYPSVFGSDSLPVDRTRLLVAPDNAREELVSLVESADESVAVKQVSIGGPDFGLLRAVLDAAERGVDVRILLSSAWYVEEDNRRLARWLDEQAETGDLPLSVKLAEPDGQFEKIHAKGVIVDGETVALGSANWNENSVSNNREVVLVLDGTEVAAYFQEVFEADWGDQSGSRLPAGVLIGGALVVLLAAVVAARLRFER
jgi:phosphatidylserine/phosphatidylglycerophosphate/cardiolipin synthase-like enzyme